jgi:hypothetical protein
MCGMPYTTEAGRRAGWSGLAIANWADAAPALAGLPSFTEEQAEKILEDGTGPNGETLRPPMRSYHMSPADARAIVAYLKSLPAEVH